MNFKIPPTKQARLLYYFLYFCKKSCHTYIMLKGGQGNDLIGGGERHDLIMGNDGDDCLVGGAGNDVILGGLGVDVLIGNAGDDIAIGDGGADFLMGSEGADQFIFRGDTFTNGAAASRSYSRLQPQGRRHHQNCLLQRHPRHG
jgi:hypothetical protein